MPKISVAEAAKLVEVERSTLYRRRKKGEISFESDDKGNKVIDLAELTRVYPEAAEKLSAQQMQQAPMQQPQQDAPANATGATPNATHATGIKDLRIRELELENQLKDKEIDLFKQRVADIEGRAKEVASERDEWRSQAQKLLLTYQPLAESVATGSKGEGREVAPEPSHMNSTRIAFYCIVVLISIAVSIGMVAYQDTLAGFWGANPVQQPPKSPVAAPKETTEKQQETPVAPVMPLPQSLPENAY